MDLTSKINKLRAKNIQDNLVHSIESDRGRIINSAALRRLQQKTQVFPLERNAAVRSRLTHSLEVQQNGRFITQKIISKIHEQGLSDLLFYLEDKQSKSLAEPLISIVEMACLMHDIGNPPFGHFGEAAINDWFKRFLDSHTLNDKQCDTTQSLIHDLCHFEGNAQAIRIVHSLSGLNLTYCQIASILKYTRCATQPKANANTDLSYLQKKVGYYFSEKNLIENIWQSLDIPYGNRHFAAYIMEAADDIAYCLADIEDAVEKGILTIESLKSYLIEEYETQLKQFNLYSPNAADYMKLQCEKAYKKAKDNPTNFANEFFIWLRVGLIHPLVDHASSRFIDNFNEIYAGNFNQALLEDKSVQNAVTASLKQVALVHVFRNSEVERLELQGYKIMSGILDELVRLLTLSAKEFKQVIDGSNLFAIETRLLNLISKKFISVYQTSVSNLSCEEKNDAIFEFYYRCRLIQDFVSGMTDQFAFDTYRILTVSN